MDFTVIIPAKNEEKHIRACLQSISNIDYPKDKFEVLVIDNGSDDKTVEISELYGADVYVKPELTISGLRNYGAKHAKGNILAFLDADCSVTRDWLKAASIYNENLSIVSFGSPAQLPAQSTWVQRSWFNIREKKQIVEDVSWHESANVFVRKSAFIDSNGFDENLITCEDYDLFIRLNSLGRQVSDKRIVAIHHREPATIKEFFDKEVWRGQSNIDGLLSHGFHLRELPSLMLPVIYILFIILSFVLFFSCLFGNGTPIVFIGTIFLWQIPFFIMSLLKGAMPIFSPIRIGLYVLLNVYFLSRSKSMVLELIPMIKNIKP